MKRRDFLKGGAGLVAAGISTGASAETLVVSPALRQFFQVYWCYAHPRLRQNIYTLYNSNPNHPTIQAYRNGVAAMKNRPVTDPTSWLYQANIHGTTMSVPPGVPWNTCRHDGFFLAWHRMYLYFFERIVRAASGDPTFSLPYWDYAPVANRIIPQPFRSPNNASNSLWDGTRVAAYNNPTSPIPLPATAVNSTSCLVPTSFWSFQNSVQGTPHNDIHTTIFGNMGAFATAGQDPIFWLHHCNIDRLWEKWLAQGGGRINPTSDASWMNTNFTFVDENKNFVQMSGDDILYTVNQLNYQYEDPRTCVPPWWYYLLASEKILLVAERRSVLASLVIARNVKPAPDQARTDLRVEDGETRERFARLLSLDTLAKAVDSGSRYLLTFEGVQTDTPMNGYFEVYLGLPRDAKPDFGSPNYVGNLSLFGADAQSRQIASGTHAGHGDSGISFALDVTDALKRLVERGEVKTEMTVTLVPMGGAGSPNDRLLFDARVNPRIGTILLSVEKEQS